MPPPAEVSTRSCLSAFLRLLLGGHHLLRLLEHLLEVRGLRHQLVGSWGSSGTISSASKTDLKRAISSSSGPVAVSAVSGVSSRKS
jgi:hypothetical protein